MDTVTDTKPQADTEVNDANPVETMKSHFLEHSQIKSNGIREVNKAGFDAAFLAVGVSPKDVKRVQTAVDNATSAAAEIAADDLQEKISGADKSELKKDEVRRGMGSTVRIPTYGGSTQVTVKAEKSHPIPNRGEGERQTSVKNGVVEVKINTKGRIDKALPGTISDRIKNALGID